MDLDGVKDEDDVLLGDAGADGEFGAGGAPRPEDIPDEEMDVSGTGNRVWMIKVPKFLYEKWSQVDEDGRPLGTLRVYKDNTIKVFLPPEEEDTITPDVPREYTLDVHNHTSKDMYIFGEQPKPEGWEGPRNAVTTQVRGTVHHEGSLQPTLNDQYRRIMKRRKVAAEQPKRSIKPLDLDGSGMGNRLASGAINTASRFSKLVTAKPKKVSGASYERAARMPRNELLDLLFDLFERQAYWHTKDLRERTRQPATYLKEILEDIANLARAGPYHGQWSLKEAYQKDFQERVRRRAEDEQAGIGGSGGAGPAGEEDGADGSDVEDLGDM